MDESTWTLLEGVVEGRPLLIRYRADDKFDKSDYPTRLNIFWSMQAPDHNGLVSPEEGERVVPFEDRLVDAVEHDGHSILSVVLTCNGKREFVFHTADPGGFLARLEAMPQEVDQYPITIQSARDPEWTYDIEVIRPQP